MTTKEARSLASRLNIRGRSKMSAEEVRSAVDTALEPIRRARRSRAIRLARRSRISRRGY